MAFDTEEGDGADTTRDYCFTNVAKVRLPDSIIYNNHVFKVTEMAGDALDYADEYISEFYHTTLGGINNYPISTRIYPSSNCIIFPKYLKKIGENQRTDAVIHCFDHLKSHYFDTYFLGGEPVLAGTDSYYWFLRKGRLVTLVCHSKEPINVADSTEVGLYQYQQDGMGNDRKFSFGIGEEDGNLSVIDGLVYLNPLCFNEDVGIEYWPGNTSTVSNSTMELNDGAFVTFGDGQNFRLGLIGYREDHTTMIVKKRLKVGQWNLIGTLEDHLTFAQLLDNNKGVTSGVAHDMYASTFDFTTNSWGAWANAEDSIPTRGQAIMVYPAKHAINGSDDLGDDEVELRLYSRLFEDMFESEESIDLIFSHKPDCGVEYPAIHEGSWLPLANPFFNENYIMGHHKLYREGAAEQDNADEFANIFEMLFAVKNYGYFMRDDSGTGILDWEPFSISDSIRVKPGTGFILEKKTEFGNDGLHLFIFDNPFDPVYNGIGNPHFTAKTAEVNDNEFEFSARTDSAKKRLYAHVDERAENGYDSEDSHMMFSVNEDAVNAYFSVENNSLLDNRFKDLPYTCTLNFHAQKDKEVAFTMDKAPSNIRVSLIDLENDSTETVLNLNEPINISANEGENEGRYLLKFGAMSSALNPIASAESTIEIYNNEDHIFISGKDLKSVEIVNTLGQTMQTEKIGGEKAELYTKVPAGAYLVKAYNAKGESKVQKVVINR